jgi:anti-sigma B factor antagonist
MQHVKVKRLNGVVVAQPRGFLVGGEETDELEKLIKELSTEGNVHLVINLGETQHINSTALGVLITGHTNYARRGGQMKLCSVDKRIQNIFVITKLSLVFDVYDTEEKAIASFASGKPSTP